MIWLHALQFIIEGCHLGFGGGQTGAKAFHLLAEFGIGGSAGGLHLFGESAQIRRIGIDIGLGQRNGRFQSGGIGTECICNIG